MTVLIEPAPGKVNLCLFLGPSRSDGRHDLVSVVQAVSLADELRIEAAAVGVLEDEVICDGVEGPNLANAALSAYREQAGWNGPPVRLTISKRVPIAAGMGGGSADAGAALRLVDRWVGVPDSASRELLRAIAPGLGSDVPALLSPGLALVGGAGEEVAELEPLDPLLFLVLPSKQRLATAEVFAEADRLGLGRSQVELDQLRSAVLTRLSGSRSLSQDLLQNDLELAARSLCPAIDGALDAAIEAGAQKAMVSGSGPTVFGIFAVEDGDTKTADELAASAAALTRHYPGAAVARAWVAPLLGGL